MFEALLELKKHQKDMNVNANIKATTKLTLFLAPTSIIYLRTQHKLAETFKFSNYFFY